MEKKRLDFLLVERGIVESRTKAQALILSGSVWSNGQRLQKPGDKVRLNIHLEIRQSRSAFASRGGMKLQHAIDIFKIRVTHQVCLDIGSSTGGFTDCLLKNGAKHVFAVDVGNGQLDCRLRKHPQVSVSENLNARHMKLDQLLSLNSAANEIKIVTIDVSFISIRKVLSNLSKQLSNVDWILLFKPQFEVGRKFVLRGGIVRDQDVIQNSLQDFESFASSINLFKRGGPEKSPTPGKKSGNVEFLYHYV